MAEYVNKAKLMNRIESELMRWGESEYNALQILGDIEDFPTAEVVEVVHGKWIFTGYSLTGDRAYQCSLCNFAVANIDEVEMKHCPNCGAKMDKEG